MQCNNKFTYWLFLILLPLLTKGQNLQFSFHNLNENDQLSATTNNYYLFQDSEGLIWISSTEGVYVYDGDRVSKPLENINIQSPFFAGRENSVWFSSYKAIYRYDRKTDQFHAYQIENAAGDTIDANYQLLYFDTATQQCWVSTDTAVYQFHPTTGKKTTFPFRIPSIRSRLVKLKDHEYDFLLINPRSRGISLTYFQDSLTPSPRKKILLPQQPVSAHYLEGKDQLWLATGNGLLLYDMSEDMVLRQQSYAHHNIPQINNITDAQNGYLIVSTPDNGLYFIDKKTLDPKGPFHAYADGKLQTFTPPIDRIYIDRQANLWISSEGNGIYFTNLKKNKIKRYLSHNEKRKDPNNLVKSITENKQGQLLCLTGNNIEVIDPKTGVVSKIDLPRSSGTPFYIYNDHQENLWYCSNYGLFVKTKNKSSFERVDFKPGNGRLAAIFNVLQLKDSTLLLPSLRSGIVEVKQDDKGQFYVEPYRKLPSRHTETYTYLFESSDRHLFLCKEQKSILIYDQSTNPHALIDSLRIDEFINGFAEDEKRDCIWLATDKGLYQINSNRQGEYSLHKDALFPAKMPVGLLIDSLPRLWVSTHTGLFCYTPHEQPDSVCWQQYRVADGLQSTIFQYWAALELSNGQFAFGGSNGLNAFNPHKVAPLGIPPNPTLRYIEINNQAFPKYVMDAETKASNVSQIKKLVLRYDQNDLFLRIAALEYSDPSANQYRFEMTGNEDTVIYTKNNDFPYPNIQPGHYTLTYNASNSDGVWFPEREKKLEITILPPWWQRWWARTLFALLAIAIVIAFYQYRIRQVRKEEAIKREMAEYKQLAAETETAVLRLQMNPHFIFNSMNSISSYIAKKDIQTANDYLHRFAKLMRMILNLAAKPLISVGDEVELLEQYLQTEAMRFEKKFSYEIKLEEDMDPDEYLIPTMILQPFVENAIWHGLSNRKGQGNIEIRFWQAGESLQCSIQDNGVGRKAAGKGKLEDHESKAMSITAKRLAMLETKNGVKAKYEIEDLKDEQGNAKGTRVQLQFPLL